MTERRLFSKFAGSPAMLIVGAVADTAAVVSILSSDKVLQWIGQHPTLLVALAAIFALLIVVALDQLMRRKAEISQLNLEKQEVLDLIKRAYSQPSPQDRERFKDFWADLGTGTELYAWLKREFLVSRATKGQVTRLGEVLEKWEDDLTTYRDKELAELFEKLKKAASKFNLAALSWYFPVRRDLELTKDSYIGVPAEWEFDDDLKSQWRKAMKELREGHKEFMEAYRNFVSAAQEKKLTDR